MRKLKNKGNTKFHKKSTSINDLNLTLFLGTGVSIPSKMPTWDNLIKNLH